MITGFCGQISLGHAAFYGIGAYCAAMVAKAGASLPVSLLMGLVMAGIVGVIVGLTSLRVREDFLAIVTMGVGFLFVGVVIATVVLTLMPEFFRFISDYKLFVYGALLFAVMRFAPEGLAGSARSLVHAIQSKGGDG